MTGHPSEPTCIQDKVIIEIQNTLSYFKEAEGRREGREERMLIAMENVAAHGATLEGLSVSSLRHDKDIQEAFIQIRALEQSTASSLDMEVIKKKVETFELRHAEEHGERRVQARTTKFWDGVKQQVTPYVLMGLLFIWWLSDKYDAVQKLFKLYKEFRG